MDEAHQAQFALPNSSVTCRFTRRFSYSPNWPGNPTCPPCPLSTAVATKQADSLARLDACGRALGLAFQIQDDLLDVESDALTLGKEPGSDSAAQKLTFPAVWGVARSREILAERVEEVASAASALPGGGGRLPELARFVRDRRS